MERELDRMSRRARVHVTSNGGLTNEWVNNFCKTACYSGFYGVYSADYIPPRLHVRRTFIIIVNLGQRRGVRGEMPVGHFVTISGEPDRVTYIDPYGLPCEQVHVRRFLNQCRRPIVYNSRQIQDFNSVYCGMYAILFTLYIGKRFGVRSLFQMRFFRADLLRNDDLCVKYIRRLLYTRVQNRKSGWRHR